MHWPQCNLTLTKKRGTIRGMPLRRSRKFRKELHPLRHWKNFRRVVGRAHSPTFGQWEGFELSSQNRRQLYVPSSFGGNYGVGRQLRGVLPNVGLVPDLASRAALERSGGGHRLAAGGCDPNATGNCRCWPICHENPIHRRKFVHRLLVRGKVCEVHNPGSLNISYLGCYRVLKEPQESFFQNGSSRREEAPYC